MTNRISQVRDLRNDQGSLILALLGVVILTVVASVGLVALVNGQAQTRHDNAFAQALNNAESGVDAMVATIKAETPLSGGGTYQNPTSLTTQTITKSGLTKSGTFAVSATPVNNLDTTGSPQSTIWTIHSVGTAKMSSNGKSISRRIDETVTIANTYTLPVLGKTNLDLNGGSSNPSGVTTYTATGSGATPTQSQVAGSGIDLGLLSGLGLSGKVLSDTISNVPVGGTPGPAQTGGTLDIQTADLGNYGEVALDGANTVAKCVATNTAPCNTSTVVQETSPPPPIMTNGCDGYASGVNLNGVGFNTGLPAAAGLVFNTTITTSRQGLGSKFCTDLPIVIPNLGALLNGVDGLTGLTGLGGTLDVPVNATCTTPQNQLNFTCAMNNPTLLYLNEVPDPVTGTTSNIILGTPGATTPTYVSAIIASPSGECDIYGNVVLTGTINCNSIVVESGGSLQVLYPSDEVNGANNTNHVDTVNNWNECEGNRATVCGSS
ncbi:MAG TPA: hypothetical protein VG650_03160 [Mycobacteriales bacterium]|nr:hypothetical protein [Mycobacteriales bacterium]